MTWPDPVGAHSVRPPVRPRAHFDGSVREAWQARLDVGLAVRIDAAAVGSTMELGREQPGFLGIESVRGDDGAGITVSYWRDLESIRAWKANEEHRAAQQRGQREWYSHYVTRVCKVEYDYERGSGLDF